MEVTLHLPAPIDHQTAVLGLAALNWELRAAHYVACSLPPDKARILRTRCRRLQVMVPVLEALVQATDPQRPLPDPNHPRVLEWRDPKTGDPQYAYLEDTPSAATPPPNVPK